MPVSSLVAHLSRDEARAAAALEALRVDPVFEVGARVGGRVPLVLDAATDHDNARGLERLRALPGVAHVDVLWILLDDDGGAPLPEAKSA